jgi:hypothetical protein
MPSFPGLGGDPAIAEEGSGSDGEEEEEEEEGTADPVPQPAPTAPAPSVVTPAPVAGPAPAAAPAPASATATTGGTTGHQFDSNPVFQRFLANVKSRGYFEGTTEGDEGAVWRGLVSPMIAQRTQCRSPVMDTPAMSVRDCVVPALVWWRGMLVGCSIQGQV